MDSNQTYGILQLAALGLFLTLGEAKLRRRGATLIGRPDFIASCVLGAGIGGRLHYIVEGLLTARIEAGGIVQALNPLAPGSTFFGAMFGVLAAIAIRRRTIPGGSFARLADEVVPGFALAIFVGRLGCLLHGCCLGEASDLPWAIASADGGAEARHPLPLYIGLAAIGASVLSTLRGAWIRAVRPVPGDRVLLFTVFFCAGRAWAETYRQAGAESTAGWGGIESMLIAGVAAVVFLFRRRGDARDRSTLCRGIGRRYASRA